MASHQQDRFARFLCHAFSSPTSGLRAHYGLLQSLERSVFCGATRPLPCTQFERAARQRPGRSAKNAALQAL